MPATIVGVEIGAQVMRVAVRVTEKGDEPIILSITMPQSATKAEVIAEGRRLLALRRDLIGQSVEA